MQRDSRHRPPQDSLLEMQVLAPRHPSPPSVCPVRDRQENRRLLSHAYELYSMKAGSSRFQVSVDRLTITSSISTYSLLKGRPSLGLPIQLYLSTVYKRSCISPGLRESTLVVVPVRWTTDIDSDGAARSAPCATVSRRPSSAPL
jgi:hypothetical protein